MRYRTRGNSCSFNPRICKRCDVCKPDYYVCTCSVSIHASVKDATYVRLCSTTGFRCFNPRICKRCDSSGIDLLSRISSFNPRICKRCDIPTRCRLRRSRVSIHASVKDATKSSHVFHSNILFQSTHL